MYPANFALEMLSAEARSSDLLAEAAHQRRIAQARSAGHAAPALRHALRRVFTAGERVRGTNHAPAVAPAIQS